MAGRNEVVLTFAGDADKLEKEVRRVTKGNSDLETSFARMGAAAKASEDRLSGVGGGADRLHKVVGDGGRQFGDYGKGLGGVGDRFDEVDTRAMGAADGFAGLTDAMKWSSLSAQEQAMVFSDLGSSMYNLVIPSLQSGVKAVGTFAKSIGGLSGGLALLAPAAIAAGVGFVAFQADTRRAEKQAASFRRQLEETGTVTDDYAEKTLMAASRAGELDVLLSQVASAGGYEAAESFVAQAEALGGTEESMLELRGALSDLRNEYEPAVANIEAFNDALQEQQDKQRALVDPLFASITATNDLAQAKADEAAAQQALNDAIAEGDPTAITEAQRALADAHLGVADAAYGEQAAQETLMGALATGQTTVAEMRAQVDELERSGRLSGDAAGYLRDQINSVQSKDIAITANIWNATQGIGTVQERLASLDKSVQIDVAFNVYGQAELNRARALAGGYNGAIVPGYAADGGLSWSSGPRGTDTVPMWLTPGEMVLNKGQQSNLFDAIDSGMIGGGQAPQVTNVVNVTVQGSIHSERDIVKVIRNEAMRGGFRGAL